MTYSRTQEEEAPAQPEGASVPSGAPPQHASLMNIAVEAANVARSFFELLILELRLAAQSIPKLICVALMAVLLMVFAWLSFAASVAWLSAVVFKSTGWGILAFLVLQLLALFACVHLARRYSRRLTLPNSRGFIKQLEETWNATDK